MLLSIAIGARRPVVPRAAAISTKSRASAILGGMNGIQFPGAGAPESGPSCAGPFAGIQIEYPVRFDLRIIYALAEAGDLETALQATLARISVPCSLIQGVAKPGAKYGRMGARVTVDSKAAMDRLYAEAAKLPGVKAVI